jgi:hypothetical protein
LFSALTRGTLVLSFPDKTVTLVEARMPGPHAVLHIRKWWTLWKGWRERWRHLRQANSRKNSRRNV